MRMITSLMALTKSLRHMLLVVELLRHTVTSLANNSNDRFSNGTCVWGINGFPLSPVARTCPLLTDEYTAFHTGKWSPWSHRPDCNNPVDDYSPQYCLFTDDTFRGGQGISILTTPEIAADVANALDDSNIPPSFRTSTLGGGAAKAPYKITDIPGRGKSLVATRRIRELETIVMGYPALITINDMEGASYDEVMELLQKAVDQLQSTGRRRVNALARSNNDESHVRDVIRTNSFGLDLGDVRHMGVFPRTSRMNHDCRPNTYYRLLPEAMAQQVIARRDIEIGEEITHSYTGHGMPYAERRGRLAGFNFNCTCSLCSASEEDRAQSDKRRYRLRDILTELVSYKGETQILGGVLNETLSMVETEDMWFLVGTYYAGFAKAYLGGGDFESAEKYGLLAEEMAEKYRQEEGVAQILGNNFWGALKTARQG